jgi:hypothetical protein
MLPITHINYSNCVDLLQTSTILCNNKMPLFFMAKWLEGARINLLIHIPTHWNQFQNTFTLKQLCFIIFCLSFGLNYT